MVIANLLYSDGTDFELFLLVKQNDVKAFEEIYNRYWPDLINTAYKRLSCKEKAEDIVQNIFVDVYQRRSTINVSSSLQAYLNRALKFQILNAYRSDIIRAKYQNYYFLNNHHKNDFAIPFEAKELETRINSILDGLPEKCKRVFLLSRKDSLSNKSIADCLNISVSSVEKYIVRALKAIRNQIEMYN